MEARQQTYASNYETLQHSNCLPVVSGIVAVLALLFFMAIESTMDWASHTVVAGLWSFLAAASGILFFICASITGWHVYKGITTHRRKLEKDYADTLLIHQTRKLLAKAPEYGYTIINVEQTYQNDGKTLKSTQVSLKATVLEAQARREQAKQRIVDSNAPAGLLTSGETPAQPEEDETPIPIPEAPNFWDIVHLITEKEMPLCFVVDVNPDSATYMQTIPAFGTILDLLSLCVIGRPGRGKSVFLLYYLCILARYGSEIHICDPQGAFKELMLLHGKPLPSMPATARIYYYSDIEEMEQAVSNITGDIGERSEYYKPHMEGKRFVRGGSTRHPLVVMCDELPIIAEMDIEIKNRVKEENRIRKEEGLEALKARQVISTVKTAVLQARKYAVYFIGVSQSIDASILPTRVTSGFNSRIVFSTTLQKARMAGLESEEGKIFLPVIKRAGPGKAIYDCGRWDDPLVAAFPMMTIEDVLAFFGISMEELEAQWVAELTAQEAELTAQEQEVLSDVDGVTVTPPHLQIVPSKNAKKRATLADAIEVWNEAQDPDMGRPQLRDKLQAKGLECSDYLSDQLLKAIKRKIDEEKLA